VLHLNSAGKGVSAQSLRRLSGRPPDTTYAHFTPAEEHPPDCHRRWRLVISKESPRSRQTRPGV